MHPHMGPTFIYNNNSQPVGISFLLPSGPACGVVFLKPEPGCGFASFILFLFSSAPFVSQFSDLQVGLRFPFFSFVASIFLGNIYYLIFPKSTNIYITMHSSQHIRKKNHSNKT
eukprot:TRINITY_DN26612_c0_g1_i1.p1 TRINITY_DN26612_c0_g1~~TRINITY_DN26612_c0_g1_i1.p1  ORF type:complete len:114 (-),score=4.54 TRINITY_DN26612_c0_g1_i1:359-700(-)